MKYVLDNSNLAESYSGVTTPLTYSFASHVYREVYKHFCRRMGVSQAVIGQQAEVFSDLLCFVGYRMYYNLRNWHSVVAFLPAYKFNRHFFDKMLGVETDNPYHEAPKNGFLKKYMVELPRVSAQIVRIGCSFALMGILVRRFNREFDETFARLQSINLTRLTSPELTKLFRKVSEDLLARWWVPIANDFAVMVSTGIANKAITRWLGQTDITSHLYLEARGSLISLDPGRLLMCLVRAINRDEEVKELFCQQLEPGQIFHLLSQRHSESEPFQLVKDYLAKYGARVPNELKLESETLIESPELLINLLQSLVQGDAAEAQESEHQKDLLQNNKVRLNSLKRNLLKWLLSWVGNSIRRREETRLRRALIFGYVRRIFLALGINLSNAGIIDDQRDVFYLTEDEALGQDDISAKEMVALRKAEIEEWKRLELPRRIESDGSFDELLVSLKGGGSKNQHHAPENMLKGTVASRGCGESIRGTALVLPDFSVSADYHGKVLVTRHTDPGWTIIFPFLKALIVERGGSLSHAAIVSRELGIPCVMGVENAVNLIPDGASVEVFLATGEIRILGSNGEYTSPVLKREVCVS